MKKILVGFDGSETAAVAADQAAELARAFDGELHVVTVIVERADSNKSAVWVAEDRARDAGAARSGGIQEQAIATAQEIQARYPDLNITTHALKGAAAKRLVEVATDMKMDVIVVGNRRVQGVARVLGSVAIDVLRDAPCAVHVVKTT